METKNYDVCIVGAGSAGMAAAYALKESGLKVALVEKNNLLGGTATACWVDTWIAGINPPYLEKLFGGLQAEGKASGDLDKSILPARFTKDGHSGNDDKLIFDPKALAEQYAVDMQGSNVDVFMGFNLPLEGAVEKDATSRRVDAITISSCESPATQYRLAAPWFIDSTADGVLCRAAGCEALLGEDSYERFNEPLMEGKTPQQSLNEPSLLFKIGKGTQTNITPSDDFNRDGYLMNSMEVNPMYGLRIDGSDVLQQGADLVHEQARKRTPVFWDFLRRSYRNGPYAPGYLDSYVPVDYAPMLGIRESWRIACDYMLRQQDLEERISSANLKDYIACGSLVIDFHVYGSLIWEEVQEANKRLQPSGIPYRCLLPKALDNVWIACRAYGASHIALAARRVNKDMAQLGWAAGHAARMCVEKKLENTRAVTVEKLQDDDYTCFATNVKKLEERLSPTRNLPQQPVQTLA
ncbi:MAG: FAD-dependent oxidoreductase [Prevotellaceae bacterium]|jgi:hypothetical protein|nr:FAD-dependent oxidoreductase [Prevotellaceae bacterium]